MVITMKQWAITLCLTMTLALAGCQTTGQGVSANNTTQADSRLQNNADVAFFSKSGWQACAGGAALGALACALSNSSNKGVCIAAAAVAGCGVGMGANAYLDNQRQKYASKEMQLNASINDVQAENKKLQNASAVAKTVIDENRQTMTRLNRDIAAKRVDRAAASKKLAGIDANIVTLRKTVADMKTHEKQWVDVSAAAKNQGSDTAKLDSEIEKMHHQVVALQAELDSLYTQRTALKVS